MADTPKDTFKKMIAWDAEPTLTDDEVEELPRPVEHDDKNGLQTIRTKIGTQRMISIPRPPPAGSSKAARAASLVAVDPPESGIVTSKVFDNCRIMAKIYSRKNSRTVNVGEQLELSFRSND
jgi:hypothetical protein